MTKRLAIITAVLVAALTLTLSNATHSREPSYEGRPLSAWLSDLYHNSHFYFPTNDPGDTVAGPRRVLATIAVRSIGTNAFPALISMLGAKDSRLKLQIWAIANKQTFVPIPPLKTEERRQWAFIGFDVLRSEARSAQPALVNIALHDNGEPRKLALAALSMIDQQSYKDTARLLAAEGK